MNNQNLDNVFNDVVKELSDYKELQQQGFLHEYSENAPFPSAKVLEEVVELCRTVFFPGYFGKSSINSRTLNYHLGVSLERLYNLLRKQILAGLCFDDKNNEDNKDYIQKKGDARDKAMKIIYKMPEIRNKLITDVEAAYKGDPAATNFGEVISCYPAIKAISNYRFAHELYKLNIPLIPRIITEMAHSETGIDIHPGADIDEYFTIDHGTGVVIGATCIIGKNVKLYQGVTLGAKSFPLDENGMPIKGVPRHPIIKDDVIIYSNATILGRVTIGKGSTIGANVWVTKDIKAGQIIK